jgi:hypothetical protein
MGINGTNGYYIFKYSEKYYTFLNVYDSYPEWLGRKLVDELRQMGFSKSEIEQIQNTSIRSPLNVYEEGPWAKLNNAQAQKLINTLYDGI